MARMVARESPIRLLPAGCKRRILDNPNNPNNPDITNEDSAQPGWPHGGPGFDISKRHPVAPSAEGGKSTVVRDYRAERPQSATTC